MTDYTILGAPRMSAAGFRAVLLRHKSPAAAEAGDCYRAFVHAGVDPAVGLAVFGHESSYGRAGKAVANRSWGNLRHNGAFVAYPSWTAGAADAARLLAIYGHNQIRPGKKTSTTQTFPYVWAPSADGNAPDAYGNAITAAVASFARLYPVVTTVKPHKPPKPARWYVVRAGDTLSGIARSLLGSAARWTEIYRLNRSVIDNPGLIHPGERLRIPPK